jgi:acyl carrier protein
MTQNDIRRIFVEELVRIAPDLDASAIGEDDHLQEDLDLDSMDVLNLVAALHARLGVTVQESDYPHLATLSRAVPFLADLCSKRS